MWNTESSIWIGAHTPRPASPQPSVIVSGETAPPKRPPATKSWSQAPSNLTPMARSAKGTTRKLSMPRSTHEMGRIMPALRER